MRRVKAMLIAGTGVVLLSSGAAAYVLLPTLPQQMMCLSSPYAGWVGLDFSAACAAAPDAATDAEADGGHAAPATEDSGDHAAAEAPAEEGAASGETHAGAPAAEGSDAHGGEGGASDHAGADAGGDAHGGGEHGGGKAAATVMPDLPPESIAVIQEISSTARAGLSGEVRKLLDAQSAMAGRWTETSLRQRQQLVVIDQEIDKLAPDGVDEQVVQSLALFILSGGPPARLKTLVDSSDVGKTLKALVTVAVAHALGNRKPEPAEFRAVEVLPLSRPLRARLALAEAQQIESADGTAKLAALRRAADLTPGSLVEEAAIRRILIQTAQSGRSRDFTYWADRYARRFSGSAYFAEFEGSLSSGILLLARQNRPLTNDHIARIMLRLPKPKAVSILTRVSSDAVVAGLADLCIFSSTFAKRLTTPDDPAYARLTLNRLACSVTTSPMETLAELRKLSPAQFDPDGQTLLAEATSLAQAILETLPASTGRSSTEETKLTADPAAADASAAAPPDEMVNFEASVAQQLDASSQVLEKGRQ